MPVKTRHFPTLQSALTGIGSSELSLGLVDGVSLAGAVSPGDGLGGLFQVVDTQPVGGAQTWEISDGGLYLVRARSTGAAAENIFETVANAAPVAEMWHADDVVLGDIVSWGPRIGSTTLTSPGNAPEAVDITGRRWVQFDSSNTEILTSSVPAATPDRWILCLHMIPEHAIGSTGLYATISDVSSGADYGSVRTVDSNNNDLAVQTRLTPGNRVGTTSLDINDEFVVLATYSLTQDSMQLFVNGVEQSLTLTTNTALGAGPFNYDTFALGGRSINSGTSNYAEMKLRRAAILYDAPNPVGLSRLITEAWHGF